MKRAYSSLSRSALALATIIGFAGTAANAQVPPTPKACGEAVMQAGKQANLSADMLTQQNAALA